MGQSKIRDFSLLKGDFIFRNPALKNNSLFISICTDLYLIDFLFQ